MTPTFDVCYTHNNARLPVMYNKTTHFHTCIEYMYGLSHHFFTKGSRVQGQSRSCRVISIPNRLSIMISCTGSEYLERMVCWKSQGFAKHSGVSQWVMMTDSTSHPDHIRVQVLNQSHGVPGVCNDSIYRIEVHFLCQDNLHPLSWHYLARSHWLERLWTKQHFWIMPWKRHGHWSVLHWTFTSLANANTPNEVMSLNFEGWLGQVHTHMLSQSPSTKFFMR